jgi:nucleotide-binding universal stress UspA family protein
MKPKKSKSPTRGVGKPLLPLKRFLVPIDFSPRSQLAVKYAGGLAQRAGAAIDLLFVAESAPFYTGLEDSPLTLEKGELTRRAKSRLRSLAATLKPSGVEADIFVRHGKAPDEISAHARERGTNLILIPTHGYSGAKRVLMGSTTERVLRQSPCAVLTLRLDARAGGVRRGEKNAPRLDQILAPVDFSEQSGKALRVAAELAQHFQSKLTILHVVFSPPPPRRLAALAGELVHGALKQARRDMAVLVRKIAPDGVTVNAKVLAGIPREGILRTAGESKCDLIVMATQGRRGLERWVMGSTAEHTVRYAPCPVLVVR